MKNSTNILKIAKQVIDIEAKAIKGLSEFLDDEFVKIIEHLNGSNGRIVITGIGKSADISKKIVSTLNSTGSSSLFLHTADAIHGDLGILRAEDTVLCISNSGETPELKILIPLIKEMGSSLIAMTGNQKSYLAEQADYMINTQVDREACPHNLAPTSSTTAQLVMGDVLALCLLEMSGFSSADFAKLHPAGILGKKLYLRVKDLFKKNEIPSVREESSMNEVICEISSKRLGATAVIRNKSLVGMITDGDLRRMLHKPENVTLLRAKDIMNTSPITIDHTQLLIDALALMRSNNITQLAVLEDQTYVGIIHLHDILKEGIL